MPGCQPFALVIASLPEENSQCRKPSQVSLGKYHARPRSGASGGGREMRVGDVSCEGMLSSAPLVSEGA